MFSSASTVKNSLNAVSKIAPEAIARAREAMLKNVERYRELEAAFKDMPEPKCSKCGRVIYCGVDGLCQEPDCGLKHHDRT